MHAKEEHSRCNRDKFLLIAFRFFLCGCVELQCDIGCLVEEAKEVISPFGCVLVPFALFMLLGGLVKLFVLSESSDDKSSLSSFPGHWLENDTLVAERTFKRTGIRQPRILR